MNNSIQRSASVTAAGIIAMISSVFAVLVEALGFLGLWMLPRLPKQAPMPESLRIITLVTMIFFLAVSVFGIWTARGCLAAGIGGESPRWRGREPFHSQGGRG